jgi:aconitate hydratase
LSDPTEWEGETEVSLPQDFLVDDSAVLLPLPEAEARKASVVRGPNIKPFPTGKALEDSLSGVLALKVGDNITTDHIMPAGARILPYRSNVPYLSRFCFEACDPEFPERAKGMENPILLGGENYGQGSSREHAALVPMYLGVRCVIAKSFARIHAANLINAGILPLTLARSEDYDLLEQGARLTINDIRKGLERGEVVALSGENRIPLHCDLTLRQRQILFSGGLMRYIGEGGV